MQACQGQGAYGTVYRAVRVGQEHSGPVALKLSILPRDRRFAREAQLLSRLSHPGIPRLVDSGALLHPSGAEHPFFVMEWVEGMPLYAWAQRFAPSGQQLCRVLAGLARTLEALHASGAVHRDVKGDNVLVRLSDRSPVLLDFGSGHFQGAERLTWRSLAPFTPEYLSPQAFQFDLSLARHRDSYYPPSAADDVYALGITAYRLVMGEYLPPMKARQDEQGSWHVSPPDPRPLLERNPQLEPRLRELILRLLSEEPEARGTAAQAAQVLEALASEPVPQRPARAQPGARVRPPWRAWTWKPWLAVAAVGVCALLLCSVLTASLGLRQSSASQAPDAGTTAVGDTSPTESQTPPPPSTEKKPPAQQPLPELRPGQTRPDKKGRCPGRRQVLINGGCWLEQLSMPAEECVENDGVLFQGKCFAPVLALPKKPQPTSSPSRK